MANYFEYGNKTQLPTARGGLVDQNPNWVAPRPAGSAPVRSVSTTPFTVPGRMTTIPALPNGGLSSPSVYLSTVDELSRFPSTTAKTLTATTPPKPPGTNYAAGTYNPNADQSRLYSPGIALPPAAPKPTTQLAALPPIPLNRPSAFATHMDDPAYAAAYLKQYGLPPPTAVAAELSTMPPVAAVAPPAGGQLAALLEAAQGLGGLLSGVLPGGSPQSPQQILANSIPKDEAYNRTRKAGMTDWTTSGMGTVYSPTLRDKHTSQDRNTNASLGHSGAKKGDSFLSRMTASKSSGR